MSQPFLWDPFTQQIEDWGPDAGLYFSVLGSRLAVFGPLYVPEILGLFSRSYCICSLSLSLLSLFSLSSSCNSFSRFVSGLGVEMLRNCIIKFWAFCFNFLVECWKSQILGIILLFVWKCFGFYKKYDLNVKINKWFDSSIKTHLINYVALDFQKISFIFHKKQIFECNNNDKVCIVKRKTRMNIYSEIFLSIY